MRPSRRTSGSAWGKTVGLGAQHVVAMFGATFVFPLIMGLNANLAIMMSGIATICFLLIVQGKVPSYLGTSASFVGAAAAIYTYAGDGGPGGPADVTGAILVAGIVLAIVGVIIHFLGAGSVNKVLPPAVTGAVVMLIGFNLAPVATKTYMPSDPWVAILTMVAVILMAVGLKGFLGRIAVFMGLIFGYLLSWLFDGIFGQTSPAAARRPRARPARPRQLGRGVRAADWFGFPVHTADGLVGNQAFTPGYAEVGWHCPSFSLDLHPAGAAGRDRAGRGEPRPRQGRRRDDQDRPRPGARPCGRRRRRRHRDHQHHRRLRRPRRTPRTSASWPPPASTPRRRTSSPRSWRSCSA